MASITHRELAKAFGIDARKIYSLLGKTQIRDPITMRSVFTRLEREVNEMLDSGKDVKCTVLHVRGTRRYDFDGYMLSFNQKRYVDLFTNPRGKFYMDQTGSFNEAFKNDLTENEVASRMKAMMDHNPDIKLCIKDRMKTDDVDSLLEKGLKNNLEDFKKINFFRAADMVFRLRGDYAPEKSVVANIDVDEREQRLAKIAELIKE